MKNVKRIAGSLVLAGLLAFFLFGFLATFEPMNAAVQLRWRVGYGALIALTTLGIVRLNRRKTD